MAEDHLRHHYEEIRAQGLKQAELANALHGAADEIDRLRYPWRAVDDQDWQYLESLIPDGGRGRFWKAVFAEMKAALSTAQDKRIDQ